jgi:hypothetical protein
MNQKRFPQEPTLEQTNILQNNLFQTKMTKPITTQTKINQSWSWTSQSRSVFGWCR